MLSFGKQTESTGVIVFRFICSIASIWLLIQRTLLFLPSSCVYQAQEALERFSMGPSESVLVVDGRVLSLCLSHFPKYFVLSACQAPAVVCCRCSPTQKAAVVSLLKQYTNRRTCAVGDGGNDVSMIQAAVSACKLATLLFVDWAILHFSLLQSCSLPTVCGFCASRSRWYYIWYY